tara:strand:+ start:6705 stop:8387 length:1683 start_codon:yes stop_codon:yes gene_type:complete
MLQAIQLSNIHDNKCLNDNNGLSYKRTTESKYSKSELIVKYYYQSVLHCNLEDIEAIFDKLIQDNVNSEYFDYILKLIIHTRDIYNGKGLWSLTYVMLNVLTKYCFGKNIICKKIYFKILKHIVSPFNKNQEKPYGSWKDIKYFLNDLKYYYYDLNKVDEIIDQIIINIYIPQIIEDIENMKMNNKISLCGKWLPRERSKKYKWLAKRIAKLYQINVVKTIESSKTIYKNYRTLLSNFNKYLETTQIFMNHLDWDKIDFNKVTSKTLLKYKNSFLNDKNLNIKSRIICKENLIDFINDKIANNTLLKGGNNIMPHELVHELLYSDHDTLCENRINIINLQWKSIIQEFKKQDNNFMKNYISCIDVSPSMYSDDVTPFTSAIGIGLACSEINNTNKVFTFSEIPQLIDVTSDSLNKKVDIIIDSQWGATTNIHIMFDKILQDCLNNKASNEDMDKYGLIIFSDTQFNCDNFSNKPTNEIFENIRQKYNNNGYSNIPFLIFWNLRQTNNFPTIENSTYSLKICGNSPSLLKFFMSLKLEDIKKINNWTLIKYILDNERYNIF